MADTRIALCGIYAIRHDASGKSYIGSAVNIKRRFKEHRGRLRRGTHHAQKLQRSWDKYGESAFSFIIIETITDPTALLVAEQRWLDSTRAATTEGFNSCPTAGNILGIKRSAETRAKMSAWQVGRKMGPMSEEHRAKISAGNKGKKASDSVKRAVSEAQKGRPKSAEHRAKLSAAVTGFRHTPEAKAKIAAASRNRAVLARSADAQLAFALDGA